MKHYFAKLKVKLVGVVVVAALLVGLFAPVQATPVKAACRWGDIICDMQQAIQQLVDNYVTPLRMWAQLQANKAVYSLAYSLSRAVASFMWNISKMLTTVGVGIGILNHWIAVNFFQPMIQMTSATTKPIVGVFLFAALGILGVSYLLAALIRLNVVSMRSVVMWWLAGALFYSVGPSLYLSMRNLQQSLNSLFYGSALSAMNGKNPFVNLTSGDPAANSPIFKIPLPCSNFPSYIAGSAGKINGLDVALAFQKSDGFDVVNGGSKCLGGGQPTDLPRQWLLPNGFFDQRIAPPSWASAVTCPPAPATCDPDALVGAEVAKMQASVNQSFAGIAREWQSIPLVWFGIVEQLVGLCLIIAQGLTFISFACAILFAFFRRTEPVAWAIIDQWIALIIQSIVIALVQGMTIALYLAAANFGSPLVTMGVSVVALVMMVILLISGFKAVWSAFNKLFEAFGQASGGVFLSPGQAGGAVAGAAVGVGGAALTGGLSLASGAMNTAGALAGGAQALNSGATWAQAAGVTMGGSKALDGAALTIARLPGLCDTALGEAANQYMEGASVRQVGNSMLGSLPAVGGIAQRLGGALLGARLLTDHNPDHAEAVADESGRVTWRQPMLRSASDKPVSGLLTSPTWEPGTSSTVGRGGLPLREPDGTPVRKGDILNETANPQSGLGRGERFTPLTVNNDGNLDETVDADFKRTLKADKQTRSGNEGGSSQALDQAAQSLTSASSSLKNSADMLKQTSQTNAVQSKLPNVEGRLNVSGANHIAAVMGRAVDALAQENHKTGQQGSTSERVGAAMTGVMGVSPVERDGKPVMPIEGRLNRYQLFADQALNIGLNGTDAAQVLREVKANPEGRLLPATRDRLIRDQHEERGEAWADSVQHVQALEHAARIVPASISAYGTRPMNIPPDAGGQSVQLSPMDARTGAVIFTPTARQAAPTIILTPMQPESAPAVIFSPAQTENTPALDGMRAADAPDAKNTKTDALKADKPERESNE